MYECATALAWMEAAARQSGPVSTAVSLERERLVTSTNPASASALKRTEDVADMLAMEDPCQRDVPPPVSLLR